MAGAMHRTDGRARVLTVLLFGFDRERFYVRLDAGRRMADLLADGLRFSLTFLKPEGIRYVMNGGNGRLTGSFFERSAVDPKWVDRGPRGSQGAAGTIVEVALPLSALGVAAGSRLAFFLAVSNAVATSSRGTPEHGPVELMVPTSGSRPELDSLTGGRVGPGVLATTALRTFFRQSQNKQPGARRVGGGGGRRCRGPEELTSARRADSTAARRRGPGPVGSNRPQHPRPVIGRPLSLK